MKKNWTKIVLALGPVILMSSITWEYARTSPDYNFLIQPWSMRGYETTHGWVIAVMGALLLIGSLLTAWEGSMSPRVSAAVTGYLVVASTAFAAIFTIGTDRSTVTIPLTTITIVAISAVLAATVSLATRSRLRHKSALFKRALPLFVAAFALFFLLIDAVASSSEITIAIWVAVFVLFLLMAGLSVSIKPADVAANRMLIFTSVAAWTVVVLSAGAIRQTLLNTQRLFDQGGGVTGVSAQYKDTQAATGWWLAGFAATVLFVGAVGLWAKRRDIVAAMERARKQREAAEESSREIREALEAFEKEQAASA